jgi:hypothetical protein
MERSLAGGVSKDITTPTKHTHKFIVTGSHIGFALDDGG